MKLAKNTVLVFAGVLVALGIIAAFVSILMVHGDFKRLSTTSPYEKKSYSAEAAGINNMILNDSDKKVMIVKSPDDKIHLSYYDRDNEKYTIHVSNGRLSIDFKRSKNWYDYIGIDFYGSSSFKIAVPDDMACDFSLNTSNALISAENISEKGNLSVKTSNGDVVLSNIKTTGSLKTATSNGKTELSNIKITGSVESACSNGEISAKEGAASGFFLHSSDGELILTDLTSQKEIDAETSNSKVQIGNISVGTSLKIGTSNGDIAGNISAPIGDFHITSRTSNGNNSLPESLTGGSKALNVKTSNGNINLRFSSH